MLQIDKSSGIWDVGQSIWGLTIATIGLWVFVCLGMLSDAVNSNKIMHFTVTFPYLVLIILFFTGLFQEGSGDGVRYYFGMDNPNLIDELKSPGPWIAACVQIMYWKVYERENFLEAKLYLGLGYFSKCLDTLTRKELDV